MTMNSKAVNDKLRRSKRQASLDVSPEVSLANKKKKKIVAEVNEPEKSVSSCHD